MASNERSALNLKKFCSRRSHSFQPLDTARSCCSPRTWLGEPSGPLKSVAKLPLNYNGTGFQPEEMESLLSFITKYSYSPWISLDWPVLEEIDGCAKQHNPWKQEKGVMTCERPELSGRQIGLDCFHRNSGEHHVWAVNGNAAAHILPSW